MKRRKFLSAGLATSGLLLAGGTAGFYLNRVDDRSILTLEVLKQKLSSLKGQTILSTGSWSPSQIFLHCAKSVEFSMIGFPIHKSELFKSLVGTSAFAAFASLGKMSHGLDEPIPGEANLNLFISSEFSGGLQATQSDQDAISDDIAIEILLDRLVAFEGYQGELKPHFAYGELTKAEYELAHILHVYNHFNEISV